MRQELTLVGLLALSVWICVGPSCSSADDKSKLVSRSPNFFDLERPLKYDVPRNVPWLPTVELPAVPVNSPVQKKPTVRTIVFEEPVEVSVADPPTDGEIFQELKKGDTLYELAMHRSTPWLTVYNLNEERLEGECLVRHPNKPSLCRRGQWQYRMEVGDYVEFPSEFSPPSLMAGSSPRDASPSKTKKVRVRALRMPVSPKPSVESPAAVAMNSNSSSETILQASVSELTVMLGHVRIGDESDTVRHALSFDSKIEKEIVNPAVPRIVPKATEPEPARDEQDAEDFLAILAETSTSTQMMMEDGTLEHCTEDAVNALVSLRAKRAIFHRDMYFVCLKNGTVSSPLLLTEVQWLKQRKPDVLAMVGEHSTDMVCPVRQDCSRQNVWLRL